MIGRKIVNDAKRARQQPSTNGHAAAAPGLPKPFDAYYDRSKRRFYHQLDTGEWKELPQDDFSRMLRARGFVRENKHPNSLTWTEAELMRIQLERGVDFCGELAGYPAGIHEICGRQFLICKGPVIPEPKKGSWPILKTFFAEMLHEWQDWFFGWLKCARQSMKAGPPWRPGQILILAGPAGCGKNLCQAIITEILGGRAAKPYQYMTGDSPFNRQLLESEHLVIQDELPLQDIKSRRIFGARIKDFVVNELQQFHAKGIDAITLTPFWRLSISLNEEVENLQILPPLDESIRDKIMLFRCHMTNLPFDGGDPRKRAKFRSDLSKEIPGFLFWLKNWEIPAKIRGQRFGVTAALDPTLVAEIDSLSPEFKLWSLIQTAGIIPNNPYGWCGHASELESLLRDKYRPETERLLSWSTACGVYLARLAQKFPDRISQVRGADNARMWRILPGPQAEPLPD